MGHAHAALRPIGPCVLSVQMSVFIMEMESALGYGGALLHANSMERILSGLPSGVGLVRVCLM